jgi:hypothetical protein
MAIPTLLNRLIQGLPQIEWNIRQHKQNTNSGKICYTHRRTIESAPQGWSAHPLQKGGEIVTVYEAISLMLTFGMLIVALLSFHKKK